MSITSTYNNTIGRLLPIFKVADAEGLAHKLVKEKGINYEVALGAAKESYNENRWKEKWQLWKR